MINVHMQIIADVSNLHLSSKHHDCALGNGAGVALS